MSEKRVRLRVLDILRGVTLLCMIAYHTLWDLVYIYGVELSWYTGKGAYVWQQSICWTFIILSGFCFSLGRRPLRRGIIVFACGAAVTLVTALFMPSSLVVFGVLTLIGSCMMMTAALDRLLLKLPASVGALICALLFVVTRNIPRGGLGFEGWHILSLPELLYRNHFTAFFGFAHRGFYSTDYFPLLPWIFLFLFGYFLHKILEGRGLCQRLLVCPDIPVIGFIGRHTLPIYMLHQPLIYAACELIFSFLR